MYPLFYSDEGMNFGEKTGVEYKMSMIFSTYFSTFVILKRFERHIINN